jgi:PhnB protein
VTCRHLIRATIGTIMTTLNPYLNFPGTARDAITFYARVFGGEPTVSTFGEFGMAQDPAQADLVMHSQLTSPSGLVLMASDSPDSADLVVGSNVSVSLSGDDEAELRGYWDALVDGGQVTVPMEASPWGDVFGMLVDKFGINWLVNVAVTPPEG